MAGRDHRQALRNGHDAYDIVQVPGLLVAVVCDGCGSEEHSEVGAKLGARLVTGQVRRYFHNDPGAFREGQIDRGLMQVRRSVLGSIDLMAKAMGGSYSRTIGEYFLFTVLGVILTEDRFFVFGAGDGVVVVNGDVTVLAPAEGNAPEYLGYGLVETEKKGLVPILNVFAEGPTTTLESLLVGTDGVKDLIGAAEKNVPGKEEKVGPISQFWENNKVFQNQFTIQRRLNVINRSSNKIDYESKVVLEEHGHLPDDTTLVVVRRQK